jgi:hydrogenase maturation factor
MSERLATHGCVTCGDEAVIMKVLRIDSDRGLALCAAGDGRRSSVEIGLVEPVLCGERLLVHAGTALGRAAESRAGSVGRASPAEGLRT